jgi:hypothetical protein
MAEVSLLCHTTDHISTWKASSGQYMYVAVLSGVAGPDDENIFQLQIKKFCLEDQG